MDKIAVIKEPKRLTSGSRIICFIAGLIISSIVFVWGFTFQMDNIAGYQVSFIGFDMTSLMSIAGIVLVGILGGYLVQVAFRGKTGFD